MPDYKKEAQQRAEAIKQIFTALATGIPMFTHADDKNNEWHINELFTSVSVDTTKGILSFEFLNRSYYILAVEFVSHSIKFETHQQQFIPNRVSPLDTIIRELNFIAKNGPNYPALNPCFLKGNTLRMIYDKGDWAKEYVTQFWNYMQSQNINQV